jgi:hypothetical protein
VAVLVVHGPQQRGLLGIVSHASCPAFPLLSVVLRSAQRCNAGESFNAIFADWR